MQAQAQTEQEAMPVGAATASAAGGDLNQQQEGDGGEEAMAVRQRNGSPSDIVQDYCCRGKAGTDMMLKSLGRVRQSTMEVTDPDGIKRGTMVNIPSLLLMQVFLDFPWLDVVCTKVRAQGKCETYICEKDEVVAAVDALSVLLTAQDVVLKFISSDIWGVIKFPPLWYENWKRVVEKIVEAVKVILSTQQEACLRQAVIYKLALATKLDSSLLAVVCEGTLRAYVEFWELAFGQLLDVVRAASFTLLRLGQEGPESPAPGEGEGVEDEFTSRAESMSLVENFLRLDLGVFRESCENSRLYRRLMDDPNRYIFTSGFHVYTTLLPDDKNCLRLRAGEFEECIRRMQDTPKARERCEQKLRGEIIDYLEGLVSDMQQTDYNSNVGEKVTSPTTTISAGGEEEDAATAAVVSDFVVVSSTEDQNPPPTEAAATEGEGEPFPPPPVALKEEGENAT